MAADNYEAAGEGFTAYIALGSNLGDKEENLRAALRMLASHPQIRLEACSSWYRTAPVGYEEQDWFLNAVACITTTLSPRELLAALQETENRQGRVRTLRWGPRTLDLDILLYGDQVWDEPDLFIPHPRLGERAFVLVPLAELNSELALPGGEKVEDLLASLQDSQEVLLHRHREDVKI